MPSVNNCGVCARPLVYASESVTRTCDLCGKKDSTAIYCPAGHYVCDACHSKEAIEVLTNPGKHYPKGSHGHPGTGHGSSLGADARA